MAFVGGRRAELVELRDGVRRRYDVGRDRVRRASPGPMLVRFTATGAAFVALALAMPLELWASPALVLALVLAAGVGLAPRTRWVTLVLLLAVVVWLVTTAGFHEPIHPVRLVFLTGALYVTHTSAAFAAVLPYDAVLSAVALGRWALRVGAVVVVSLTLGITGIAGATWLSGLTSLAVPLVGIAAGIGLVALMAWLYRRG